MKGNKWPTLIIILLAIALISITIFVIKNEKKEINQQEPKIVYVEKNTGEILENFTRKDAVKALNNILVNVGKDIEDNDRNVEERLKILEKDNSKIEDVLRKEVIDNLYLEEEFGQNNFNLRFIASGLLVYNRIITEAIKIEDFKPVLLDFDELVYFDRKLMSAQIPLDIFIGKGTGMSFEMQYIDGEWKLNPYTAIMSLNLMSILSGEAQ